MDKLKPKSHAEAVALFRSEIIGHLTRLELDHGELQNELRQLSKKRYRPPASKRTRQYARSTLERWYYRYKKGGLETLCPKRRSDSGRAQRLTPEQRKLLLDIRREYRSASVSLILRTLIHEGRLERNAVSESTVRRLYVDEGLDRIPLRDGNSVRTRLRWQAEYPGALWHADVCHGPPIIIEEQKKPLRIHAILDDAARYIVAIQALHNERELDMLHLFVQSLYRNGPPDALYLDNGSTYRGNTLRLGCERLGITLLHAAPYDPEARGKMERFWRTLRQQCLNFIGNRSSLHEVNVRLWSWLDMHYHRTPHAGLLGRTPQDVWSQAMREPEKDLLNDEKIRRALTVNERRRVRRDNTLTVAGLTYQLDQGFLAGRVVTVAYCMLDEPPEPSVIADDKTYAVYPVDPVKNSKTKRLSERPEQRRESTTTTFNPAETMLRLATGRRPVEEE